MKKLIAFASLLVFVVAVNGCLFGKKKSDDDAVTEDDTAAATAPAAK